MKYSKWRICRHHRSVPLFPWRQKRKRWNPRQKRNLRNISSGHVWKRLFRRHLSRGNRRFPGHSNAASHFGKCHYRADALHRSVSDLSPGWRVWKPRSIVSKRFSTFLNRWQDATSRLARQFLAGVSSIKRGIGDINASFFFFPSFFYSDLGICWERKRYFVFWKGEF